MSKTNININFNNKNYSIDESTLSAATHELRTHLSTTMSGTGATLNFGGTTYNVDSAKLSAAMNNFIAYLGTVAGSDYKVVVGGVEYGVGSDKVAGAIGELEAVLGGLNSGSGSGETYTAGLYKTGAIEFYNTYGMSKPAPELNEYGFYFGEKYYTDDGNNYFIFYEDGSALGLAPGSDSVSFVPAGVCTYTSDFIYLDGEEFVSSFSPDGTQMSSPFGNLTVELCTELSDMLIVTWDELVDYGFMTIDDGALYHTSTADAMTTYVALPTCELAGDLLLPQDGKITSIATEAFDHECKQLTGILIPNGVTAIGDRAFELCKGLITVTIPESVTSIGEEAFLACESLKSITIPKSVTNIGDSAFNGCNNLTSITFDGTVAQWTDIAFGVYFVSGVGTTEVVCSDGTISLK